MKKTILFIAVITFLATSCKKEPASPKSYWTFDGTLYKGFAKTYGNEFSASEKIDYGAPSGYFVAINFFNLPSKSGIFKVRKDVADSTQCKMTVCIKGRDGYGIYYDSVDSTSEVMIGVSPDGKFSAHFSDVVLSAFNDPQPKTVSGVLEEQ